MHFQQGRTEDSNLKKSILWNVVEPGDPYDIRKSMIAQLPGDKKMFMGNKLELVCLLQAAEIQRLALFLEDYKLKYRELERNNLDRHSYEVQIKELADRVQNDEAQKNNVIKLKDYIKRQSEQIDDLKRQLESSGNQLSAKYQQALLQIHTYQGQLKKYTQQIQNLNNILLQKNLDVKKSQSRIVELEEQINKGMGQYEEKFTLLGTQIQRLNGVLRSKTMENNDIKLSLNKKSEQNEYITSNQIKLNEIISLLNETLDKVRNQNEHLIDQNEKLGLSNQQLERKLSEGINVEEYQMKLEAFQGEIQRLNGVLRNQLAQKSDFESKSEYEKKKWQADLKDRGEKIKYLEVKIEGLQNNNNSLTRQLEKINNVLKQKIDELNNSLVKNARLSEQAQSLIAQIKKLEEQVKQFKQIQKKIQQLQRRLTLESRDGQQLKIENQDLEEKVGQYENRIVVMLDEIKRLNQVMLAMQRENANLHSQINNYESINRQLSDKNNELKRKLQEHQKMIHDLSQETQRINELLKFRTEELKKIEILSKQNANQRNKVDDYERKFALISMEIERLNGILKLKEQQRVEFIREIEILRKKDEEQLKNIAQLKNYNARQIHEITEKFNRQMANKQDELIRISNTLKARTQQLKERDIAYRRIEGENMQLKNRVEDFRNKIGDIQRLNNLLRLKVEQSARWEQSNIELSHQLQQLQGNLQLAQSQSQSHYFKLGVAMQQRDRQKMKINDYHNKIQQALKQVQRLQGLLETMKKENIELKGHLNAGAILQQKNKRLMQEITRLMRLNETQKQELKELRLILADDHAMEKRLKEQLSLMVILFAQIESLRERLDEKEKQIELVRLNSLS